MLVPHLLKIYFGLGWPSSVLEIVSSQRLKTIDIIGGNINETRPKPSISIKNE